MLNKSNFVLTRILCLRVRIFSEGNKFPSIHNITGRIFEYGLYKISAVTTVSTPVQIVLIYKSDKIKEQRSTNIHLLIISYHCYYLYYK